MSCFLYCYCIVFIVQFYRSAVNKSCSNVFKILLLTACQVRCIAEAVYQQDTMQIQDLCGFTNIRDQRAVPRKVKVGAECRSMGGDGCYNPSAGRLDALGVCLVVDTDLAFVALCLAAAAGDHDLIEVICKAGEMHIPAHEYDEYSHDSMNIHDSIM